MTKGNKLEGENPSKTSKELDFKELEGKKEVVIIASYPSNYKGAKHLEDGKEYTFSVSDAKIILGNGIGKIYK